MIDWPNPCACLGPINGEPHCPCVMTQCNLPRSTEHLRKQIEASESLKLVFDQSLKKK